jgi:hypothetical protein
MEIYVVSAIVGLGYYFTRDGLNRNRNDTMIKSIPKSVTPNGTNVYNSQRSVDIRKNEQLKADKLFERTKNSSKSNVMIPGPPLPIFNKVDYNDARLPIEFTGGEEYADFYSAIKNEMSRKNDAENKLKKNAELTNLYDTNDPVAGGIHGISLTGEQIDPATFFHKNMVPFFGGSIKQGMDDLSNKTIMEHFTGNISNYKEKVEIKPLFQPEVNLTNPYGTSNLSGYNMDRYIVSNIRNNETPVEKVYVGPGLNKGYAWEPEGGFQQSDTRDYILPKTTDEMRVKTNPKVSYQGKIISGKRISQPTKIGTVQKNLPDTFYINTPDKYFTTVGSCAGAKQRSKVVMKYVNRKTTEQQKRVGPAAPTSGSTEIVRSNVKVSSKSQYETNGMRNNDAQGQWTLERNSTNTPPNDYGRSTIQLRPNDREITGQKTHVTNVSGINKTQPAPVNPDFRKSTKQNVVGNARWASNVQTPYNKHKVYDPNDIARVTIKETNINNNHTGNFGKQGPSNGQVYDPNNVARTTIKETNINNNHTGNFGKQGPSNGQVYDPNNVARTTIKETNIDNNHTGNFGKQGPSNGQVYDPNNVARTTIKETNIDNNHTGNFGKQGPSNGQVYDPNNVARTTIKETNIDNNHTGNFGKQGPSNGQVYDPNNVARTTIKETNIDNNHTGNFGKQGPSNGQVYDPNNIARTTIKETNIDNNHTGNFGKQGPSNGQVYDPNNVARVTIKEMNIETDRMGYINNSANNMPKVYNPNDKMRTTNKQTSISSNTGNVNFQFSGGGYEVTSVDAPNTTRQFTSQDYTGGANTGNDGGYQVAGVEAPNTIRQFTTTEYTGTAGSAGSGSEMKQMSYADIYNSTIKSLREDISQGRTPSTGGPTQIYSGDMVNATTSKLGNMQNKDLSSREHVTTRVSNSIPQHQPNGVTRTKEGVPNEPINDRLDPAILDAFKQNPYTQSLSSYSFA